MKLGIKNVCAVFELIGPGTINAKAAAALTRQPNEKNINTNPNQFGMFASSAENASALEPSTPTVKF